MAKRVAILGSTGSIGTSALAVLRHLGDDFELIGLAANTQWQVLASQIAEFRPKRAVLGSPAQFPLLAERAGSNCVELACGPDAVAALAASDDVDIVLNAIVGAAGLAPALAALRARKTLALANKECMVMAGELLNRAADDAGAHVVPVDSEHSAIFQSLQSGRPAEVRCVWLTASGGPFRTMPLDALDRVTPEQALRHPNWAMGPKITVDSATMMNKALEIVEARWLFRLEPHQIRVLVHPQSIIHSMVEFRDGSTIAQLGVPDMRVPIQYALTYPERRAGAVPSADLAAIGRLDFAEPDPERFPALALGHRAAEAGGTMGAVLNAANEVAVQAFLRRRLSFPDISRLVADVMAAHRLIEHPSAQAIAEADRWARQEAEVWLSS
ncbi:MAG TPA: 1-deoxy-D-xylulose-5-phosphate reductoisomerase [Planctomycetota bacterium]|nr:1-deoxy-D-xylulose-5-phosphate reductoisomerase [Planctomycetota bacterium]HRR82340.1 1-deoxy-D-xylulose-5-phosphate reductoisomerase [Planctomycetota bacterium]HRT94612.1 1-deoxy-D-xylulose-5-phosphate reductoisomerase [Planctomycetota bacterium]